MLVLDAIRRKVETLAMERKGPPRFVVRNYRHYSVVFHKGLYHGWPDYAGLFSPAKVRLGLVPAIQGKTIGEVKAGIDRRLGPVENAIDAIDWAALEDGEALFQQKGTSDEDSPQEISLIVEGYRRFNIIHCSGLYYGWPWSAGGFSLQRFREGVPSAVVARSVLGVKSLIDAQLGVPTREEESKHAWEKMRQLEDACANETAAARNYRHGRTKVDNLPVVLIASVAFGCNVQCGMCYLESEHDLSYDGALGKRRNMTEETFQRVLRLFPSSQHALMTVEGEILAHKQWFERWQKEVDPYPNLKLSFQTNGTLMTKEVIERILSNPRFTHVQFSVDGATPEINDKIRSGVRLTKLLANIGALVQRKRELGLTRPNIHTHFVMQKDNIHELADWIKKMIELGVNSMTARHIIVMNKEQIKDSLYFYQDLCDENVLKARDIVRRYGQGVSISLPPTFAEANAAGLTVRPSCNDPWRHGQVLHDGSVFSCCNNAVKMGNINEDGGFENVWNNEKYQLLRATVNSEAPAFTACKYCNAMLPINNFEAHVHTKLLFKLIKTGELEKWCPGPIRLQIKPGEDMVE